MTEFDLGWVVAFLEGEGSFTGRVGRKQRRARVTATNTDREPLEKLKSLLGGAIYEQGRRFPNWSPAFQWHLGGQEARRLMLLIRPYMSAKRQAQIDKALAEDTSVPSGSPEFIEQRRRAAQIRWAGA